MEYRKVINKYRIFFKYKYGLDSKGNNIFKNFYIYKINSKANDDDIYKICNFINKEFLKYPSCSKFGVKKDILFLEEEYE